MAREVFIFRGISPDIFFFSRWSSAQSETWQCSFTGLFTAVCACCLGTPSESRSLQSTTPPNNVHTPTLPVVWLLPSIVPDDHQRKPIPSWAPLDRPRAHTHTTNPDSHCAGALNGRRLQLDRDPRNQSTCAIRYFARP